MPILSEKQFIFIIGSPRSGTTWLQIMLAGHPAVASTVETSVFPHYLAPLLRTWELEAENINLGRWVKGVPHLMDRVEFMEHLSSFANDIYRRIAAKRPSATHILDKDPQNTFCTQIIGELVTRPRFVHIIRDGRDVVCSMRNVKRSVGHQTENIAKGAAQWRTATLSARRLAGLANYHEVRYEDLLHNRRSVLSDVFRFCGLQVTSEWVETICAKYEFERMRRELPSADPERGGKGDPRNYHKGRSGTWVEELSSTDLYQFVTQAGELLVDLGYADVRWVQKHSRFKVSGRFARRLRYLAYAMFGERRSLTLQRQIYEIFHVGGR